MNYEVIYSDEAVDKLKNLRAFDRTAILAEIDRVFLVNPAQESKARVNCCASRLRLSIACG